MNGFRLIVKFSLLAFVFSVSSSYADKSYRISRVHFDASLSEDGSMMVSEIRTYEFEGSFRYAFRTFPKGGEVSCQDFTVFEEGKPYLLSESNEAGTYEILDKFDEIEVRWYYRAHDETRTFELRFRVRNAVKVYEDAAVLYYQFIGSDWDHVSRNVAIRIQPPQAVFSGIQQWLHGPLWASSKTGENGTITAVCGRLPSNQYLEIRAIYPITLFQQASKKSILVREEILQQEAQWALEANRKRQQILQAEQARRERWDKGKWYLMILSAAGFFGWWVLFKRFGQRPKNIPPTPKIIPDVPAKTPPALVGYLLNDRQIYGGSLVGTLFDLARKDIIALRQDDKESPGLFGVKHTKAEYAWELKRDNWEKSASHLETYENDLIRFLFNELAEEKDALKLKTLQKKQTKFMKFFQEWKKIVKNAAEKKNWFDRESFKGMWFSLAVSGILFLLLIPAIFLYGPWAAIIGVSALFILFLAFTIPHRTMEGEMEARQWKAFKRFFQKFQYRTTDRHRMLDQIDGYLVYGVVLGFTSKIVKELAGFIPPENYHAYVPWYIYHGTGSGVFSPDAFVSSFSNMISTTASTMSSTSGAGGGASGGGGGGAGGGGGGAG